MVVWLFILVIICRVMDNFYFMDMAFVFISMDYADLRLDVLTSRHINQDEIIEVVEFFYDLFEDIDKKVVQARIFTDVQLN